MRAYMKRPRPRGRGLEACESVTLLAVQIVWCAHEMLSSPSIARFAITHKHSARASHVAIEPSACPSQVKAVPPFRRVLSYGLSRLGRRRASSSVATLARAEPRTRPPAPPGG